MDTFVHPHSIVRQIWGKSDMILFIFAGASAEFALNKAVDWLYFTGKLPSDPIGRLFSTVSYARQIVFSSQTDANRAIDTITAIHSAVENKRGASIPDWAYRDVLFMLIDYSIRSFELLERELTDEEKQETFDVFYRVGKRMGLKELPSNYQDWVPVREDHLKQNLEKSRFTVDLFKQYEKHLGKFRYQLLLQSQAGVVPSTVNELLSLGKGPALRPMLFAYKASKKLKLDSLVKTILFPRKYQGQINALDVIA